MSIEHVPIGEDAQNVKPGDFILCHRKGLVSAIIRWGTRGPVSHAAFIETPSTDPFGALLIEALTRDVVRTPLTAYRDVEYWLVRTELDLRDAAQASAFAASCVGDHYGWPTIGCIALGYLTPGKSKPWGGVGASRICSGLVAEAQVRGWAVYPQEPAAMTPVGLLAYHGGPNA